MSEPNELVGKETFIHVAQTMGRYSGRNLPRKGGGTVRVSPSMKCSRGWDIVLIKPDENGDDSARVQRVEGIDIEAALRCVRENICDRDTLVSDMILGLRYVCCAQCKGYAAERAVAGLPDRSIGICALDLDFEACESCRGVIEALRGLRELGEGD